MSGFNPRIPFIAIGPAELCSLETPERIAERAARALTGFGHSEATGWSAQLLLYDHIGGTRETAGSVLGCIHRSLRTQGARLTDMAVMTVGECQALGATLGRTVSGGICYKLAALSILLFVGIRLGGLTNPFLWQWGSGDPRSNHSTNLHKV